jgi:hypothetical protein
MTITKRLVKGSALSHIELDGNFTDYETFKALFDTTTFTTGNNGLVLYWNDSNSAVEVKSLTTEIDVRITAVVDKSFVNALFAGDPASNSFSVQTADFNAGVATRYLVDTTSGQVTATLPASPNSGDTIEFTYGATSFATNNLILGRNGNTIDGATSNLTVSSNPTGGVLTAIYDGTTWRTR